MTPHQFKRWHQHHFKSTSRHPSTALAAQCFGVPPRSIRTWNNKAFEVPAGVEVLVGLHDRLDLTQEPWLTVIREAATYWQGKPAKPPLNSAYATMIGGEINNLQGLLDSLKSQKPRNRHRGLSSPLPGYRYQLPVKITQKRLAELLGVSAETIKRWESKKCLIPLHIYNLLHILHWWSIIDEKAHRDWWYEQFPDMRPSVAPSKKMMDQEKQLIAGFLENTSIAD